MTSNGNGPPEPCLGPHICPGGCGESVTAREICCQPCFLSLETRIKLLIWKSHDHAPDLLAEGVRSAKEWFRNHPRRVNS